MKIQHSNKKLLRNAVLIGFIGVILVVISTTIWATVFMSVTLGWIPSGAPNPWRFLFAILSALIGSGCVMVGICFYNLCYKNIRKLGVVTAVMSIVGGIFWGSIFILNIYDSITVSETSTEAHAELFGVLMIFAMVTIGVMLLLQGSTIYKMKIVIGDSKLTIISSVVTIIAGIIFTTVIGVILGVGFYIWGAAYITIGMIFLKVQPLSIQASNSNQ